MLTAKIDCDKMGLCLCFLCELSHFGNITVREKYVCMRKTRIRVPILHVVVVDSD
jgi:hypothetical protein